VDELAEGIFNAYGSLTMREAFRRIRGWLLRFIRATRLSVPYYRDKHWRTPSTIRLNGKLITISAPADDGTRIAFKDIFLDDVYGLRQLHGSVQTIVDIGAHVGFFSLYARSLFPNATIHAYEPNPDLAEDLDKNAIAGQFRVFPESVGIRSNTVRLSRERDSVFTRTFEDPQGVVPQVSIEQVIERLGGAVDVLKLDCEGCEWPILESPRSLCAVHFLTMEYHLLGSHSLDEMKRLVRSHGLDIIFFHEDGAASGRIWAHRCS
jgi:FkbM family methyltransferase